MSNDSDRHITGYKSCQDAESIVREIVQQDQATGHLSWDESPLKPWIIDSARSILILRWQKSSFLVGCGSGHGILFTRCPTSHKSLIKWSAPLCVNYSVKSVGLSIGRIRTSTFSVCTSRDLVDAMLKENSGRSLSGIDVGMVCGPRLDDRADIFSTTFGNNIASVGVSKVAGTSFDICFASGKLSFDKQKNESLYGSGYDPRNILSGAVEVPAEFQSLFGEISRMVDRVERPSANPSRTSASLERFSTGVDPDAALVMLNGTVVREDLKQAPSLGINLDPPSFERRST